MNKGKQCSVSKCAADSYSKLLCERHYMNDYMRKYAKKNRKKINAICWQASERKTRPGGKTWNLI